MTVLHHLALGTLDVERLAQFYGNVVGLRTVARHSYPDGSLRSVWLDLGGAVLMIEPSSEPQRLVSGVGAGLFLLALKLPAARRAEFEQRLASAGCEIESRSEWTAYTRDPDGNRLAFSDYPLHELAGPSDGQP